MAGTIANEWYTTSRNLLTGDRVGGKEKPLSVALSTRSPRRANNGAASPDMADRVETQRDEVEDA